MPGNPLKNKALRLAAWGVAGLAGALAMQALRVPVAWLLGPMLASMALRTVLSPPARARVAGAMVGQWLIGAILGARFSLATLQAGTAYVPPLLALIGFTAALCLFNGWLLRRMAGVDYNTAFLGTLPGAASAVVAMSSELDVDRQMVTVLMYVRVLLIILLVPVALSLVFGDAFAAESAAKPAAPQEAPPAMAAATMLLAVIGSYAARRVRLPSPNFMGAFLLVIILKAVLPAATFGLPPPFFQLGLLLLGCTVGIQFDLVRMKVCWRPALVQAGLVAGLLAACMAAGYGFHLVSGVDLLTAILGTTPGGKETMIALSIDMGGNAEMVMAMQTFRWLLVLFLGPSVAGWLAKRGARGGNG